MLYIANTATLLLFLLHNRINKINILLEQSCYFSRLKYELPNVAIGLIMPIQMERTIKSIPLHLLVYRAKPIKCPDFAQFFFYLKLKTYI